MSTHTDCDDADQWCWSQWKRVDGSDADADATAAPSLLRLADRLPFQRPVTTPPARAPVQPANVEDAPLQLSVAQYVEELWSVDAANGADLIAPPPSALQSDDHSHDDDDSDEAVQLEEQEEVPPGAHEPGTLPALLHALYRFPTARPPAAADQSDTPAPAVTRFVHLQPRHPNLLPIEEYWTSNVAAASPAATVATAAAASPSATAASTAHHIQFASVPLSLHTLLRFYQRPNLLACMRGSDGAALAAAVVLSPEQARFISFQLMRVLAWLHGRGLAHGALTPHNVRLTLHNGKVWVYMAGMRLQTTPPATNESLRLRSRSRSRRGPRVQRLLSPLLTPAESLCYRWWSGSLSNLHYILALNALVGRAPFGGAPSAAAAAAAASGSAGGPWDVSFHPIVPWVVDFAATEARLADARAAAAARGVAWSSRAEDGSDVGVVWRDLSRSKYRLRKGDEQLDFQYNHSEPHKPYHITECLSDITFFVYRARVTPLATLRSVVRSNFVPGEYPSSFGKMESWSAEESVPEFYEPECARIFRANDEQRRLGMGDLAVPSWIQQPDGGAANADPSESHAAFLRWHRAALESPYVSSQLHHWIDLNFGYKLSGAAAVEAKNVPLLYWQNGPDAAADSAGGKASAASAASASSSPYSTCVFELPRRPAFMQLFDRPHPPRRAAHTKPAAAAPPQAVEIGPSGASSPAAAVTDSGIVSHPDPLEELARQMALLNPQHVAPSLPPSAPFTPPTAASTGGALPFPLPDPVAPLPVAAMSAALPFDVPNHAADASAALESIPSALDGVRSLEYFAAFDTQVFSGAVLPPRYDTPPRGIAEWRREKARAEERRRRRRRGEDSSSDSDEDGGSDSDDEAARTPAPSAAAAAAAAAPSLAERQADDVFRLGLIIAELFLPRPLFNERSFAAHCALSAAAEPRALDALLSPLPLAVAGVVRRCLPLDWRQRCSARSLLADPTAPGVPGLFRVHVPHAPHAAAPAPVSNTLLNPYEALFAFMRSWRSLVQRCEGGLEGVLRAPVLAPSAGGAADFDGEADASLASCAGADTSASALLLTPFHAPSSAVYAPANGPTGCSIPSTPALPTQRLVRTSFSFSTSSPTLTSFAASMSQSRSSSMRPPASPEEARPLDETQSQLHAWPAAAPRPMDSSSCFWACRAHGMPHAPTGGDSPHAGLTAVQVLRWGMERSLPELYGALWHAAPAVFLLALPHVLDLAMSPVLMRSPRNHALLRSVFDLLAQWIGPAHARAVVLPFLRRALLGPSTLAFQMSFVWRVESLRLARNRFAYRDLLRPLVRALRNALLSALPSVAERSHQLLLEFALQELNVPGAAGLSAAGAGPDPDSWAHSALAHTDAAATSAAFACSIDEEIVVFEILLPMFQRLGSSAHSSGSASQAQQQQERGVAAGANSPTSAAAAAGGATAPSSANKIMAFLLALLPELPQLFLRNIVLPNVLALISGVVAGLLPATNPGSSAVAHAHGGGVRGSVSGTAGGVLYPWAAEALHVRLSQGLDLLFALLPDLSTDAMHALLGGAPGPGAAVGDEALSPLLRTLFLSVGPSSPRSISAAAMRKVVQIVVYCCCELAGEKADGPGPGTAGSGLSAKEREGRERGASVQVHGAASLAHTRFSFFLPCVDEFLRGVVARLDALNDSAIGAAPGSFTRADLQGLLHGVYVSLSSVLGRQQLQASVADWARVEQLVQEYAKQRHLDEQLAAAAAVPAATPAADSPNSVSAATSPTAAAAAALRAAAPAPGPGLLNELGRARQHALAGKTSRAGWSKREQARDALRQSHRDQARVERTEWQLAAGIFISVGDRDGSGGLGGGAGGATAPSTPAVPSAPQRRGGRRPAVGAPAAAAQADSSLSVPASLPPRRRSVKVSMDASASAALALLLDGDAADEADAQGKKERALFDLEVGAERDVAVPAAPQPPPLPAKKQPAAVASVAAPPGPPAAPDAPSAQGADKKVMTKKKAGFFSTGIFARNNNNAAAKRASVSSKDNGGAISISGGNGSLAHSDPPDRPLASVQAAAGGDSLLLSLGGGAPASAPPLTASAVSSSTRPLDRGWSAMSLGDLILPTGAVPALGPSSSSSVVARWEPTLRSSFRAHSGGVTSLDCQTDGGLVLSSSRQGDAAPTLKLWCVSLSQSALRPLHDYSAATRKAAQSNSNFHSNSSSSSISLRYPRQTILQAALLANPYEALDRSVAWVDGAQLHVVDIETMAPVSFRAASGHQWLPSDRTARQALQRNNFSQPLSAAPYSLPSPPHRADALAPAAPTSGLNCFAYSAPLHALVVGAAGSGVRWLDLRSGGGFLSAAWQHVSNSGGLGGGGGGSGAAANSGGGGASLRCVGVDRGLGGGAGGLSSPHLLFAGLSSGEVAIFDARTGCVLQQWRAHDAPLLQLLPFQSGGGSMLIVSALDQSVSWWRLDFGGGGAPVLMHRFSGLDDHARALVLSQTAAGAAQLTCTIGHRIATVTLQLPSRTGRSHLHGADPPQPASRRPLSLAALPLPGHKGKGALSAIARMHAYDLTCVGGEDGRIICVK